MKYAKRMSTIAPYLFVQIEQTIERAKEQGFDVISLGVGDPDMPTPQHIISVGQKELANPVNHQYPSSIGMKKFRQSVADYYKRNYNVDLDPNTEVGSLIGSKEGIGHISFCFCEEGAYNLVPDPGYPVYSAGTKLAGGEVYSMPLLRENGFRPDFSTIPVDIAKKSRILFINYPNNPTGGVATPQMFKDAIAFAKQYDLVLCHDAAYSEICFDADRAPSILQYEGAKDVAVEFSSVSKIFNMTGWRIGWVVGNKEIVKALNTFKSNLDSGAFQVCQEAAIAALDGSFACVDEMKAIYKKRRDVVVETLNYMGWNLEAPKASLYIWAPVPNGYTSAQFAQELFEKTHVVVTPGSGYGEYGEGYIRISLTVPDDRLLLALKRMKDSGIKFQ